MIYINDIPDGAVCNITIHADDTDYYPMCCMASDLSPELGLAGELKSDLQGTAEGSGKWLINFHAGKLI